MPFVPYALAVAAVGAALAGTLTYYLVNRPEKDSGYEPDELRDEISGAFTARDSIELTTSTEHAPQLLARIGAAVERGFTPRHEEMLRHRLETQRTQGGPRVARYSVEIDGASGDLEIQWFRNSRDRLHLRFEAPVALIRAIASETTRMPATVTA